MIRHGRLERGQKDRMDSQPRYPLGPGAGSRCNHHFSFDAFGEAEFHNLKHMRASECSTRADD